MTERALWFQRSGLWTSPRAVASRSFASAALTALALLSPAAALAADGAEARWYDQVKVGAFVDAYASANFANPKTGVLAPQNRFRAYDQTNGLLFHWVGLDANVDPAPVGAGVSLRFGPSAALYTGSPDNELGLSNVKQAFVAYKPGGAAGKVAVSFGKFDTLYGAEVADSQLNVTYTRSVLNYYLQPFFHTGFRVEWQPTEVFQLKALAVNGWNNAVDNNLGKTLGLQAVYKPNDRFLALIGWLGGPEQPDHVKVGCADGTRFDRAGLACVDAPGTPASDAVVDRGGANRRFRHLVDAIVDWSPVDRFRALFNASWATEEVLSLTAAKAERKVWYGVDLTVRAKLDDHLFVGLRGSLARDRQGFMMGTGVDTRVTSGTLTLGWSPTPNLIVKLEPRLDVGNAAFFAKGLDGTSKVQLTTTLGVVATTN